MNRRPDFIDAKHKCKRLCDEYTATTGGNRPIPLAQQIKSDSHVKTIRGWIKSGVHLCVPYKTFTLHPLRAMSHTLQHSTPFTGTPFPVPRSLKHCHDPRLLQRGTSTELPPLTGYKPSRIADDLYYMVQGNLSQCFLSKSLHDGNRDHLLVTG